MGEKEVNQMARRALRQSQGSPDDAGKDPIEEALKLSRQLVGDEIVNAEVAKKRAETAKAKADAAKAEKEAERAESGGEKARESDTGFKFKGGINLGEFNVMELLTKQTDELKELKQEAETAAGKQQQISDDLREKLHAKEMEVITTSFNAQMQMLTKMIEANASKGSFMDQYNMTKELATNLGFVAPGAQSNDLQATLELKKLEFENNREMRRLAREEKNEQRKWDLELRRLDDDRADKKVEQERQQKKDDMIASAPAAVGAAIAKGIIDSGGGEAAVTTKGKSFHVEAAEGAAGDIECPGCSEPVGIGPTANRAVCANCGTSLTVKRTKGGTEVTQEEQ